MTLLENITDEIKGVEPYLFSRKLKFSSFLVTLVQLLNDSNKRVMVSPYTLGSSFIVVKPVYSGILH